MASSLLTKIQTKLQANPIKGFSLAKKTQGFGVSSLRDLPPTLKGKYYDGILLAVSNSFNFLPNDVLWDNAAKLAVLAHPTFLDKLEEGLDAALNSFKFEIKTVLNAKTKNLYILADEKNMGIVKALEEEEQTLPAPYGAGSTMEPGGRIVTPDQAERAVSLIEIPSGEYSTGLYSVSITFFSCSPRLVTNSEYAEFMKTDPYNRASFWSKPGWAWIQKRRIDGPRLLRGGRFSQPDQPVVCVSWYEAQAYLKWAGMRFLTQHEMLYLAMSNLVQKVPAVRGMTIDSPEWLSD
ncbi:MAG: SUMF1/EgtB/PvdO family nonheme iron enzyme [Candidatus Saganbacteria bacterium]|nr:SUMF1/EgtB/PvdO family nonheme iron enzyme [Candidatus Saganbacteria bacterium]